LGISQNSEVHKHLIKRNLIASALLPNT